MLQASYEGSDQWMLRFDTKVVNLTTKEIQEILDNAPELLGHKCKTEMLDKGCGVEEVSQSKD